MTNALQTLQHYILKKLQNCSALTVRTFRSGACGRQQGFPEHFVPKSYCKVTRSISDPIYSLYKPSFSRRPSSSEASVLLTCAFQHSTFYPSRRQRLGLRRLDQKGQRIGADLPAPLNQVFEVTFEGSRPFVKRVDENMESAQNILQT